MGKGTYTLLIEDHVKENADAWLIEDPSGDKQIGIEIVASELTAEIDLIARDLREEQEKGAADRLKIAALTHLSSWLSTYRDELMSIVYLDHTHEHQTGADCWCNPVVEVVLGKSGPSLWDNLCDDGTGGLVQDYQSALASSYCKGSPLQLHDMGSSRIFNEAAEAVQGKISLVK